VTYTSQDRANSSIYLDASSTSEVTLVANDPATNINRPRIGRACSMLIESAMPIATIAADVGFTNLSLFNRQFARAKGYTPGNFRKRHRGMPWASAGCDPVTPPVGPLSILNRTFCSVAAGPSLSRSVIRRV
jgi:hypothetical protein